MKKDTDDLLMVKQTLSQFSFRRAFEQKMLYFSDGADMFLDQCVVCYENDPDLLDADVSVLKNVMAQKKNIALISLGCGDASREKMLLDLLPAAGLDYYGIDSSHIMLDRAKETLKNSHRKSELVCLDFGSSELKDWVDKTVLDYDLRIFVFFGNTFANIPQAYMADSLRMVMLPGDILWLDVTFRKGVSSLGDGKLYERYQGWLKSTKMRNFILRPLKMVGLPEKNIDLRLEMKREVSVGALKFIFYLEMKNKTEIEVLGETLTLLPEDIVNILQIRAYAPNKLLQFFEARGFEPFDEESGQCNLKKEKYIIIHRFPL
ncbi:hypothetical protein COB57_01900 [Candidatus Peregrinibacteria bacterium]|nr:MAG: hypothetical protein COB57_01900 [Candidatus Peregrinibacteria bacterium]